MADIFNTASNTVLSGTSENDSINNQWGGNKVTIDAGTGDDYIYNDGSKVSINAGAGNDTIFSISYKMTIKAGAGDDSIYGGGDRILIDAGKGNDSIHSGGTDLTIDAGAGDDFIENTGSSVQVYGNAGNDSILSSGYNVTINAGDGDDQISLKSSGNLIEYADGDGSDTVYGFNESDTLQIWGGKYSTQKSGSDVLVQVGTGSILLKDAANKKISINEYRATKLITLTKSGDEFKNKLINVAIQGLGGHDSIINYRWSDCVTINGDAGNDFLYTYSSDHVTINGGAGNDTLLNGNRGFIDGLSLENGGNQVLMDGGKGNDEIWNASDSVTVNGGAGDDYIFTFSGEKISINAGAGNDTIDIDSYEGGLTLKGGAGSDLFIYFAEGDEDVKVSNDIITDYEEEDTIKFDELSDSTVSSITTNDSGHVIFKVGKNKLVVKNAADKIITYIDSDGTKKTFGDGGSTNPKLITLTEGNDTYSNSLEGATISALGGNDSIKNYGAKVLIDSGAGNDTILNDYGDQLRTGNNVTINAGDGDDYIVNDSEKVTINGGAGNDSIINGSKNSIDAGTGDDYIFSYYTHHVTINGGAGIDSIRIDDGSNISVNAGAGNDLISLNSGDNVTVDAGAGDDRIINDWFEGGASKVSLDGGKGSDYISNWSDGAVKINGGDGNDTIYTNATYGGNVLTGGAGADLFDYQATAYEDDNEQAVSNDTITDYAEEDTIQFNEKIKKVSTNSAGSVVFTFAEVKNKLVVKNAADKVVTYIDADGTTKTFGGSSADEWQLDGTTATYGSLVVKGVTSLDGLSLSGKVLTVSAASLGTGKISVSDGYTLALGSDVSSASTKKSWNLSKTTATYKQTTTAGYSLEDNEIIYSKKSSKTLAKVTGVKSLDGLKVSGSTIKLSGDALSKKISVSGAYTFDFANDFKNATVTASSSADTIIARGKNIFVKGGAGADIFQFKSTGVIGDYESEDKISLTGAASLTTDGNDLIFNGKLTVTGGAEKFVTYIDADGRHTIEPAAKNFILSADGKSIALTDTYLDDDFDVADFGAAIQTIDASAVVHELKITGNKLANVITATAEDDYVDGGAGSDKIFGGESNDTLVGGKGNDSLVGGSGDDSLWGGTGSDSLNGGEGADTFVYKSGDGSIIIEDFDDAWDKIRVLSGDVNSPTVDKAGDVTFAVDDGQIIVKGGASKYIPIYDEGKNILMKHSPK